MSSVAYEARLRANNTLRQIVLVSGGVLSLSGAIVILNWPFNFAWRAGMTLAWFAFSCRELAVLRRAYMAFSYMDVGMHGAITLGRYSKSPVSAELLPGSVLLSHVGWLRLQAADGTRFAELVAGNPRKNKDWRRMQVIWRHL